MILIINAATANSLLASMDLTIADLKTKGRIDLSQDAYLVAACNPAAKRRIYRFSLVDMAHKGGESIASFVAPADRELLPACHADNDGTFEQRQTTSYMAENEAFRHNRFRNIFLAL